MRHVWPALVLAACLGCGDRPAEQGAVEPRSRDPEASAPVEPASLAGPYVGKLVGNVGEAESAMPPSMRELIGDARLVLTAERFELTHKGLVLEGPYAVDGRQVVLSVETVGGLTLEDLAKADLEANRKAGKEPASQETLDLYREALALSEWRFDVENGELSQVGEPAVQAVYRFKRAEG
jgi:hypothetical protein